MDLNDNDLFRQQAYINGEWVDADNGATFDVTNPATGEVIDTVPTGDAQDADVAIRSAEKAFQAWRNVPMAERVRIQKACAVAMRDNAEAIGQQLHLELGRPVAAAIAEVTRSADLLDVYAEEGLRLTATMSLGSGVGEKTVVTRDPLGVVIAITPFNYPITLLMFKLGAALIAGCSVVAKPAEDTPLSTLMLAELCHKTGLPAGVFNVVTGEGRDIGQAMIEHPIPRKVAFTGGTAAGKAIAAAAIGTETSGSILSPSSQSSLVGLKPTVGLLSRGGIVPISSTLDTPGPMTRNVTDNAILLDAMSGEDPKDVATKNNPKEKIYIETLTEGTLKGFRFGVFKNFMDNELYKKSVDNIKAQGGEAIEFEPPKIELRKFLTLLNGDMFLDLPDYIENYASTKVSVKNNADVMAFNLQDSTVRSPYGQARFEGVVNENIPAEELDVVRYFLHTEGKRYFQTPMDSLNLDAVLSINNYSAGFAAVAKYPALTIPMGYDKEGVPFGITFISRPFEEPKLLRWGYAFEQATKARRVPTGY